MVHLLTVNQVPRVDDLYRWHVGPVKSPRFNIPARLFLLGTEGVNGAPLAVRSATAAYHWPPFADTQNSWLLTGSPSEPISRLAQRRYAIVLDASKCEQLLGYNLPTSAYPSLRVSLNHTNYS